MASIEIDHVLTGSHIAQAGFVADGTYTDDGGMFNITCSLTGNGKNFNGMVPSPMGGTWTATFPNLDVGSGYVLTARITGTTPDDDGQPDITVDAAPPIIINPLPTMPFNGDQKGPVTYVVTGTATKGVGVVCTAVTRNKKKIKSIDGAGFGPVVKGTWTAKMKVEQVGSGKKLTIIAVLLDEYGKAIAQAGRSVQQK
jgi:hypothetical protein